MDATLLQLYIARITSGNLSRELALEEAGKDMLFLAQKIQEVQAQTQASPPSSSTTDSTPPEPVDSAPLPTDAPQEVPGTTDPDQSYRDIVEGILRGFGYPGQQILQQIDREASKLKK